MTRSTPRVVAAESDSDNPRYYSDPSLLLLASLASGPKRGHALVADVEQMSGARLGPGTRYGAVARLEKQKLIEPQPEEERRHPYRITLQGKALLGAKLSILHRFARVCLRRLEAR